MVSQWKVRKTGISNINLLLNENYELMETRMVTKEGQGRKAVKTSTPAYYFDHRIRL